MCVEITKLELRYQLRWWCSQNLNVLFSIKIINLELFNPSSSFCWAWVASVRELHRSAKLLENRMAYKVYSLYLTAKCRAQTGKQGEGAGGGGMTCRKWSGVDSNLGYPCCSLWFTRSASWVMVASEPSLSLVLFQSNRCTLLWATHFHACDPTCDSRPHHWTRMPFSAGLQHFFSDTSDTDSSIAVHCEACLCCST